MREKMLEIADRLHHLALGERINFVSNDELLMAIAEEIRSVLEARGQFDCPSCGQYFPHRNALFNHMQEKHYPRGG